MDISYGSFKMDALRRQVLVLWGHEQDVVTVEKRRSVLLLIRYGIECCIEKDNHPDRSVYE